MGSTVISATMACRDACCCCCLWIRGLQRCAQPLHELHAKQIHKSGKEDQTFKLKKAELLNIQRLPYIDSVTNLNSLHTMQRWHVYTLAEILANRELKGIGCFQKNQWNYDHGFASTQQMHLISCCLDITSTGLNAESMQKHWVSTGLWGCQEETSTHHDFIQINIIVKSLCQGRQIMWKEVAILLQSIMSLHQEKPCCRVQSN